MLFFIKKNYRALFPLVRPQLVFQTSKTCPAFCLFRFPLSTLLSSSLLLFSYPLWEGCLLGITALLILQASTNYQRIMTIKQIWIMPSGKLKIVMDKKSIDRFGLRSEGNEGVMEVQQRRVVYESSMSGLVVQLKTPSGDYPRLKVELSEAKEIDNKYLKSLKQQKRIEFPQQS